MTERERLIGLLHHKYNHFCDQCGVNKRDDYVETLADYLLKNSVIVPPCKIGDIVYADSRIIMNSESNGLIPCSVISIVRTRKQLLVKITPVQVRRNGGRYSLRVPASAFGKTVFLSREEAAKALEVKE